MFTILTSFIDLANNYDNATINKCSYKCALLSNITNALYLMENGEFCSILVRPMQMTKPHDHVHLGFAQGCFYHEGWLVGGEWTLSSSSRLWQTRGENGCMKTPAEWDGQGIGKSGSADGQEHGLGEGGWMGSQEFVLNCFHRSVFRSFLLNKMFNIGIQLETKCYIGT